MRSKGYEIRVSQITIGEFFDVLAKKHLPIDPSRLPELIRKGDIDVSSVDKQRLGRFADMVNKVRKGDPYIEPTDVLIVARSIADKECKGLLTFERKLLESKGLKKVTGKHTQDRKAYSITEDPGI